MYSAAIVSTHYALEKLLGIGGFGEVYMARDIFTNRFCAAKIEPNDSLMELLIREAIILRELNIASERDQLEVVPKFYSVECGIQFRCMMMELCDKDVRQLKAETLGNTFSLTTSLWITKQMLTAIEFLHRNGWIHRDIKPPNFCLALTGPRRLVLVDFGTTIPVNDALQNKGFCGTDRYVSPRIHIGLHPQKCDDLWSLYFIAVENIVGVLPWHHLIDRYEIYQTKIILLENTEISARLVPHPWFNEEPPESLKQFLHLLICEYNSSTSLGQHSYASLMAALSADLAAHHFNELYSTLDWESEPESSSFVHPDAANSDDYVVGMEPAAVQSSVYAYLAQKQSPQSPPGPSPVVPQSTAQIQPLLFSNSLPSADYYPYQRTCDRL